MHSACGFFHPTFHTIKIVESGWCIGVDLREVKLRFGVTNLCRFGTPVNTLLEISVPSVTVDVCQGETVLCSCVTVVSSFFPMPQRCIDIGNNVDTSSEDFAQTKLCKDSRCLQQRNTRSWQRRHHT